MVSEQPNVVQAGVFPSLLGPAKVAVEKMLLENLPSCEIEGKPGMRVAPAGQVDGSTVFFTFVFEGANFVIFAPEEIN